jgi:hypothetical protein
MVEICVGMQEANEGTLGPLGKEGIVCGRRPGLKAKEGSSMQDKKIRYTGRKGSLMRFVANDGFEVSSTRTDRRSALEGISTVQGLFGRRRRRRKGSDRVPFPIEFQI